MSPLLQALSSGQLLQHVLHFLFHSIVHLLLPSSDQPQPSSYRSEAGLSHHKGQVRCDKVSANFVNSVPKTPNFKVKRKLDKHPDMGSTCRYRLETFSALGNAEGLVEGEALAAGEGSTVALPDNFNHTIVHFSSSRVGDLHFNTIFFRIQSFMKKKMCF